MKIATIVEAATTTTTTTTAAAADSKSSYNKMVTLETIEYLSFRHKDWSEVANREPLSIDQTRTRREFRCRRSICEGAMNEAGRRVIMLS